MREKREEEENQKNSFAFKQFFIGIGILIGVIIFLNTFSMVFIDDSPMFLKTSSQITALRNNVGIDEDITVINGWDIAHVIFFCLGLYGWWKYCESNS